MKTLSTWFTACLLILSLHATALPGASGDLIGPTALPGAAPQFLPVEQAYQVAPRIDDNRLVLDWLIAPGYYLYQERFAVLLADGSTLPLDFEPGLTQYDDYFQRELVVHYEFTTTRSAPLPAADSLQIQVQSQGCADAGLCYPPRDQFFEANLTTGAVTEIAPPAETPATPPTPAPAMPLYTALLFAMLGGIILNLMPCVFPVLSIKALSLTNSGLSTRRRHYHGLAYTAGIISTFIAIAVLLISLRAGGEALGWGFQLQSPLFITALIYLFFVMGLGFSGILEAGASLMNIGQSSTEGQGLRQSYATGVLAAVVASPCTAPFMGTALGAALVQPAPVALTIFAGLGFGMAFPFLLLSWLPGLASRLPRPGAWMETFKQALAFPLYLTSVWLLWVLGRQAGADAVAAVLAGLVFTALAIWLLSKRSALRAAWAAVALLIALALPLAGTRPAQPALWEPYSPQRLDQLLAAERPVFVNLTADWCITCLANERVALSSADFAATLQNRGIVYLKGDWTNNNPEITALLNANGRNGVPLYLFYADGQKTPIILPQILTPGLISETLAN